MKYAFAMICLMALAGCADQTPYQAAQEQAVHTHSHPQNDVDHGTIIYNYDASRVVRIVDGDNVCYVLDSTTNGSMGSIYCMKQAAEAIH